MLAPQKSSQSYRNPQYSPPEQTRLASVAAADGVNRIETLLSDPGDETIKVLVALLEKIVQTQVTAEQRQRRIERAMGIILQHMGLPLPPGTEPDLLQSRSGPPGRMASKP